MHRRTLSTGTYDYSACFEYVKEEIGSVDLAIANLEVTLGGKPYGFSVQRYVLPDIRGSIGTLLVDYFIYYPRNGNGNFGAVDVYVQTADNPNYVLAGTYDFGQQGANRIRANNISLSTASVRFSLTSTLPKNA